MFLQLGLYFLLLLAFYGGYSLVRRLCSLFASRDMPITLGIHVDAGYTEEEIERALLLLSRGDTDEMPVLLVDCPLRQEILGELSEMGATVYLSYKEYKK